MREATFAEHSRRCVRPRQGVRAHTLDEPTRESVADERAGSFGCVPKALERRHDAVRDFDRPGIVRRSLESGAADDRATLDVQQRKAEDPRISAAEGTELCEPGG